MQSVLHKEEHKICCFYPNALSKGMLLAYEPKAFLERKSLKALMVTSVESYGNEAGADLRSNQLNNVTAGDVINDRT